MNNDQAARDERAWREIGALTIPPGLRIAMAIALLLVLNQVAPGIPQAVLILVGLYLLLKHSDRIATILADAVDDFDRTLSPSGGPKRA